MTVKKQKSKMAAKNKQDPNWQQISKKNLTYK